MMPAMHLNKGLDHAMYAGLILSACSSVGMVSGFVLLSSPSPFRMKRTRRPMKIKNTNPPATPPAIAGTFDGTTNPSATSGSDSNPLPSPRPAGAAVGAAVRVAVGAVGAPAGAAVGAAVGASACVQSGDPVV